MKATLFNIQRFSLHDGPGIRTTVFFKGCNMHCAWCHNPESFSSKPQLSLNHEKCSGCMECVKICTVGAHKIIDGVHTIDNSICINCLKCVNICPNSALSSLGYVSDTSNIIDIVLKDKKYYDKGNGGVTFSGGEPTVQYEFLIELARQLKQLGIHTCLETNGAICADKLEKLCEYIDLVLFDFKMYDEKLHLKYTGMSNKLILDNLALLYKLNQPVILRCPIIPGINDIDEHFTTIKNLSQAYDNIINVEIMPYHSIGKSKWDSLNMNYSLSDTTVPNGEQVLIWKGKINYGE